ncbi:MAG: hypothetical protein A2741_02085 [Candidatus Zambryskibacteria bacterium RIFCSPHIGHO2_01_FULL_43_27]|uniref:Uncharacterized protein n=1 Tax=Candidatus Zambryskibacteria bacterium RIFCSPLOWO2_01_FULL_43_17 TaxID=1802760 RepID=A0A1G2U136_9BACT|nr:MAG: hypothetical protein A2741_02085 [Candidatus Zambryskibacteria bacterium RIFCSPHIGHO2_01_FULL_43_27]OHA99771.1 MAG: hypothetical protein A3E93_00855 [Candidatus Zambryskibacteria bacterium RIFCSPHIGHO2_12_FULL_43_12b]OHB03225.1 MAG: hypothetical protein A2920_02565 [Candidatus Zambryskibacteria bacterium RIFCSPLOWO2_01_FULL_43_17]
MKSTDYNKEEDMFSKLSAAWYVPDFANERCGLIVVGDMGQFRVCSKEHALVVLAELEIAQVFTSFDVKLLHIQIATSDLFDKTAEYLNWRMQGDPDDPILQVRTSPKMNDIETVRDAMDLGPDDGYRWGLD